MQSQRKNRMGNPHVLVIPFPAQGHVIPMMELAQSLVKRGMKITFVNKAQNHRRVIDSLPERDVIGNQIRLFSVPVELDPKSISLETFFLFMSRKVEELIDEINASDSEKIACVLIRHMLGWAMEIAADKGIRRAVFCAAAATRLALRSSIPKLIEDRIIDNHGEIFYPNLGMQ